MQYSELKQAIQDYTQNSETTFVSNIDNFIRAAEDKVFLITQMPATKKSQLLYTTVGKDTYEVGEGSIDIRSVAMSETADSASNYTGDEFTSDVDGWVGWAYGGAPNGNALTVLYHNSSDQTMVFGQATEQFTNPSINKSAHFSGSGSANYSPVIDADTYKYIVVRMRQLVQPQGEVGIGWIGDFFWGKPDLNYIRSSTSSVSTTWPFYNRRAANSRPEPDWRNDWQNVVWDLRDEKSWNGSVNAARFDFYRYQNTYGGVIPDSTDTKNAVWEIDYIRYVKPIDSGPVRHLVRKEQEFLMEAYPGSSSARDSGKPKFYSTSGAYESFVYNDSTIASKRGGSPTTQVKISPTPDAVYPFVVSYYGKGTSDSITYMSAVGNEGISESDDSDAVVIVYGNADGNETWLSVTAPYVLLYGALVEAYTFMKGDPELINEYRSRFQDSLTDLKNLGEVRQKTDIYRTGDRPAGQG